MSDEQKAPPIEEHPPRDWSRGFDTRVHITDAKTGRLLKFQPYKLHVVGGVEYYERPVKSGNLFYPDGKVAGRWVEGPNKQMYADTNAEHIEFVAAESEWQTEDAVRSENEALRAELAALKKDKEKEKQRK